MQGDNRGVRLALQQPGADVDMADAEYGSTALMWSCSVGGCDDAICSLLDAKADTELGNRNGRTALMGAAMTGNEAAVYMLLNAKANPNTMNQERACALSDAALNGRSAVIKM